MSDEERDKMREQIAELKYEIEKLERENNTLKDVIVTLNVQEMIDRKMEIQDKGETHFNIGETLRGVGEEVAKALAGMKDGK